MDRLGRFRVQIYPETGDRQQTKKLEREREVLRKEVDNLSLDDYDEYCHDDYVCPTCNFENWACEPIRLDRTEDQLQKLRSRSELVTYLGDPLSITTKEQLTGNILVIGEPDGILIPKTSQVITRYDEEHDFNDYNNIRGLHVTFGWDDGLALPCVWGICFCVSLPWLVAIIWFGKTREWTTAIPAGAFLLGTITWLYDKTVEKNSTESQV